VITFIVIMFVIFLFLVGCCVLGLAVWKVGERYSNRGQQIAETMDRIDELMRHEATPDRDELVKADLKTLRRQVY
jgi:hypothetical protein